MVIALALAGCAAPAPVVTEPLELRCPSEPPPALYALPERLELTYPDRYVAERALLEGRHAGYRVELESWRAAWAACVTPE